MTRVFLGWDQPPLIQAVDWILGELGADLGETVVVVSGRRAGRNLLSTLASEAPMGAPFVSPSSWGK